MSDAIIKRKPYQGLHRSELEIPVTPLDDPANQDAVDGRTSEADPDHPEERTWKKRYGDANRHIGRLTEEVKTLKVQLLAAHKKELQIPSTKEEIEGFAQRYPDVFRHIRSIAMSEILSQKKDIEQEIQSTQESLDDIKRETAEAKIKKAHPDFDELNHSDEFHRWVQTQPKSVQNMVYESTDPEDCITAIDLYKATTQRKAGQPRPRSNGADTLVRTRSPVTPADEGNKRIWKTSEIAKMHPKMFEKEEANIERAREEGRIEYDA